MFFGEKRFLERKMLNFGHQTAQNLLTLPKKMLKIGRPRPFWGHTGNFSLRGGGAVLNIPNIESASDRAFHVTDQSQSRGKCPYYAQCLITHKRKETVNK